MNSNLFQIMILSKPQMCLTKFSEKYEVCCDGNICASASTTSFKARCVILKAYKKTEYVDMSHLFSLRNNVHINTPGNVVRGNQNYANEILAGASGHELMTLDRMSTNLLSHYLLISKRKNRQLGNVVLNSFHFYTRLIIKLAKSSCQLLRLIVPLVSFGTPWPNK